MLRRSHPLLPLSLLLLGAACAHGARPGAAPARVAMVAAVDSVPARDTFTVQSAALGEARPINVYVPERFRASGAPLPVLYMPDGAVDEDFPHVVRAVETLVARGAIRPVMVVGVPNTQRRRDLTGPTRVARDSAIAPRVGGSAAFRRFLRDELMPEVNRRYRTTGERAIVGESLAGLFVVETFLAEPTLFAHYVAIDPSVWWNAGAMIDSAGPRVAALRDARPAPRSIFFASSLEEGTSVGTAKLVALLRAAPPPGLRVTYRPRPDLTHGNIFRSLELEALTDALR